MCAVGRSSTTEEAPYLQGQVQEETAPGQIVQLAPVAAMDL
jgi:hypothetical protein